MRTTWIESRRQRSPRTTLLFAIATLCAIVFLATTGLVHHGYTAEFDRYASLRVHDLDSDWMDRVMIAFTIIGKKSTFLPIAAVLGAVLIQRRARLLGFLLVGSISSSILLNWLLKTFFQRPRPDLFFEVLAPVSYSFPSGHAMQSATAFGAMAIVLASFVPKLRPVLYVAAALLVFCVGLSRVYLGVHWTTDVLAGFAAGTFLLVAFELMAGRMRESAARRSEALRWLP